MSPVRAVALVARREIRERSRARSFRVSLLIGMAVAAAAIAIPKIVGGGSQPQRVGVVGSLSATARASLPLLRPVVGRQIVIVDEPDRAAAEGDVRAKKLAVAIIDSHELVVRRSFEPNDPGTTARLATAIAAVLRQDAGLRSAGLGDAQIVAASRNPPPAVRGLLPDTSARARQRITTLTGILLLFFFLSQYSAWVLTGVAEEKASRVVEVLLSTVGATELLAGKVIGIGLMAVLQAGLIAASAFVTANVTGSSVLAGAAGWTVVSMVGWFVLGYAFYCSLYAAAGSLISRQAEAQNVAFPLSIPLLLAYLTSFSVLANGDTTALVTVLSFVPATAPISMPARIAAGPVPGWQIGLAIAGIVAGTILVTRLAVTVYVRTILHTSGRVTWRQALGSRAA